MVRDPISPGDWCRRFKKKLMAKLTTKERNALPAKDFVFPKQRKFPIEDASHARDALS
jgi:hypothetical protein